MPELPLERFELFRTTEVDEAREMVSRVFIPHRLDLVGRSATLDARMHMRRIERVAASYVAYGGEVLIEPVERGPFFVVQVPLSGYSTISSAGHVIYTKPGFGAVMSPTDEVSIRCSRDCRMLLLRLEASALEAHLRDLIDSPLRAPLFFSLGMDFTAGYGKSWVNALRFLIDELDRSDNGLITNPVAAAEYEDTLITGLLVTQQHNHSDLLDGAAQSPVPSRAVSIVRELMENHPEWRHTVNSLAREANVSVRALQQGFARHLGMSPHQYLTTVRMRRAREELKAAQRDMMTVGQVVERWGLGHPGRFAGEYRRRFGELPSETLEN